MALTGTEVLQVLPIQTNGQPSSVTTQTTTGAIAALAGSAETLGTFTANGVTPVTVTTTAITANSTIVFTLKTVGGTVGAYPTVKTITVGSGFTVNATASDTSVYNYLITG